MWSYRKLVATFGEDVALVLLQDQIGYGEYDPKVSHYSDDGMTPCCDIHDEIPVKYPATPLCYLPVEVGVDLSQWKKNQDLENTSST